MELGLDSTASVSNGPLIPFSPGRLASGRFVFTPGRLSVHPGPFRRTTGRFHHRGREVPPGYSLADEHRSERTNFACGLKMESDGGNFAELCAPKIGLA